jgi:hypothetical protein
MWKALRRAKLAGRRSRPGVVWLAEILYKDGRTLENLPDSCTANYAADLSAIVVEGQSIPRSRFVSFLDYDWLWNTDKI